VGPIGIESDPIFDAWLGFLGESGSHGLPAEGPSSFLALSELRWKLRTARLTGLSVMISRKVTGCPRARYFSETSRLILFLFLLGWLFLILGF